MIARTVVRSACRPPLLLAALLAFAASGAADTWLAPVAPEGPRPEPAAAPPKAARKPAAKARAAPAPAPPGPWLFAGDSGPVELASGRFPNPEKALDPARIDRTYVRVGTGSPMPLLGAKAEGTVTRLEATYAGAGVATLGVTMHAEALTREGPVFEADLQAWGATSASEDRAKKKETKKPGREVRTVACKAYLRVRALKGLVEPSAGELLGAAREPLGLPLEIVPEGSPLELRAGGSLGLALLRAGEPVAGVPLLVTAAEPATAPPTAATVPASATAAAPATATALTTTSVVTGPDGKAIVTLPAAPGRILVSATAVRRLEKAERKKGEAWKKADWETLQTSLALTVLPAPPSKPSPAPKAGKPKKKTG